MNKDELEQLLSESTEVQCIEYKREANNPFKLARSVAAIANSRPGRVYVGVDEGSNDKPVLSGVKYDEHVHNKNRIINVITDRIEPRIQGLEVDVVPMEQDDKFVFVITIPSSPHVHGVKGDNGWRYYARRAARVDELTPGELADLYSLKKNYKDNVKFRAHLLSLASGTKQEMAESLGVHMNDLARVLASKEAFRKTLLKAETRALAVSFVDIFYGLEFGVDYAEQIPHGELTIEERECVKELKDLIEQHARDVTPHSSIDVTLLNGEVNLLSDLSLAEYVKMVIKGMPEKTQQAIWNELFPAFRHAHVKYKRFIGQMRKLGVNFDVQNEIEWSKSLWFPLHYTYEQLDKLTTFLEPIQSKNGGKSKHNAKQENYQ